MSAPATRQRMLRQVLVAVLDAPAPREISFDDEDGRNYLRIECDSAADAVALAKALRLRNIREDGQPHPLAGVAKYWSGDLTGTLSGWTVRVSFDAPFTGEFVDRWNAEGGFERHGTVRPGAELAVAS